MLPESRLAPRHINCIYKRKRTWLRKMEIVREVPRPQTPLRRFFRLSIEHKQHTKIYSIFSGRNQSEILGMQWFIQTGCRIKQWIYEGDDRPRAWQARKGLLGYYLLCSREKTRGKRKRISILPCTGVK